MSVSVKGGIWKNSEDEILKAAVMKYGLNHWSRIASLLVRKTPAQCKARWFEWLDPSIKKTEWSKEEDEKVLHLAKIFPSQWRTIAPVVGRTAHQCQERYDKLLDEAQGKQGDDTNDIRRLRPGEIDPSPETRPAKADAVDMDDDEREMLQEARARLANVQGKKAKRKAREKIMEETRRLSTLQKDRELRAAGLSVGTRKLKRGEIEYTKEIPFETLPQKGVHAYGSEEDPRSSKLAIQNLSVEKLENKNRQAEEDRHRKEDKRIMNRLKERDLESVYEHQESAKFRKIKDLDLSDIEDEYSSSMSGSERAPEIGDTKRTRLNANSILRNLPSVENEIEIDLPSADEPEEPSRDQSDEPVNELSLLKRSKVLDRKLARAVVDFSTYKPIDQCQSVCEMVKMEALRLMARDMLDAPPPGQRPPPGLKAIAADRSEFSLSELESAKSGIAPHIVVERSEVEESTELPPVDRAQIEKHLRKLSIKRDELRRTADELLRGKESRAAAVAEEIAELGHKLADTQSRIKAVRQVTPRITEENEQLLVAMTEKLKNEKARNKMLQDKYMRLASLVKVLSSVASSQST